MILTIKKRGELMTDKGIQNHYKQAQKYGTIAMRIQDKFNYSHDQFVRSILSGTSTTAMSKSIAESIEENSLIQHYHKLRILAEEQKKYFKK